MRVGLLALLALAMHGASFETWQAFDAPVIATESTSVVIHSQVRQRNRLHDFFYARVGPVVRHRLSPRLTLVGGYYFGEAEEGPATWGDKHRTFGGIETPISTKMGALSVRNMVEHHFGGSEAQEVRTRTLVQFSRSVRSWTPFIGGEVFFDQNGFAQQRITGGVRIPLTSSYRVDVSYLFDARVSRIGESRHVIQTAFRPRGGKAK